MTPEPARAEDRTPMPAPHALTQEQIQMLWDAARHKTARECHRMVEAMCATGQPANRR